MSQGHFSPVPVTSAGLLAVALAIPAPGAGWGSSCSLLPGEGLPLWLASQFNMVGLPRGTSRAHFCFGDAHARVSACAWLASNEPKNKSWILTKINARSAACAPWDKLLPGSVLSPPWRLWPRQPHTAEIPDPKTPLPLSVAAAASYRFSSFCLWSSWMRSARLHLPPAREELLKTHHLHCAEHEGFAFITALCV